MGDHRFHVQPCTADPRHGFPRHRVEENRGYEHLGNLWSPGYYKFNLRAGERASLIASTETFETMRVLERTGAVKEYPVLREVSDGQVAQHEHTVLVLEDETIVTTRASNG